jgi:hypothetical protein
MFITAFDDRTRANMEIALQRACDQFQCEDHATRKVIAEQILLSACSGKRDLSNLTEAGLRAARNVHIGFAMVANSHA